MFKGVGLFVALAIPGYLLGKAALMEKKAIATLTNILLYIAMPALVFGAVCRLSPASVNLWELLASMAVPLVFESLFILLTATLKKTNAAVRFCGIFSNCGFLGIPLASVVFHDRPAITVYISVFNIFSSMMLFTAGVYLLSGDKKAISLRRAFCNPLVIALLLGLLSWRFAGGKDFLVAYASYFSNLTTPLAMLVLGFSFGAVSFQFKELFKEILLTCFLKLLALPLAIIGSLFLLKTLGVSVSFELFSALLIASGVSTAVTAPALAEKYGGDGERTAALTLATALGCVASLPCLFALFSPLFS